MWTGKSIVAWLCVVAAAINPVAAAGKPCCCRKPDQSKAACCQAHNHSPVPTNACCSSKVAKPKPALHACSCCVKATPQLLNRPESTKPNVEITLTSWPAPELNLVSPTKDDVGTQRESVAQSGPPLLALLCKWLK